MCRPTNRVSTNLVQPAIEAREDKVESYQGEIHKDTLNIVHHKVDYVCCQTGCTVGSGYHSGYHSG